MRHRLRSAPDSVRGENGRPGVDDIRQRRPTGILSCRALSRASTGGVRVIPSRAAGSDLASLRLAAVRDGDEYIVNGQKTWNTLGQYADWIFCLVRTQTEGRPQEGISFLLIDMKSPGIRVRPIITLDGEHEINDIFFDNVRVPVANRVGEENRGWTYAKFLLGHERTNTAGIGNCKRNLARLKQMAMTANVNGRPLWEDARFRDRIVRVELELMALEITNLRMLSAMAAVPARRGPKFRH